MTPPDLPSVEGNPRQYAALARFILYARRKRDTAFADLGFGEAAWNMMLDLYVQHVEGKPVSMNGLSAAAAVPMTTALRWIHAMVEAGQLNREPDPIDRRRTLVTLTPAMIAKIEVYLADLWPRAIAALVPQDAPGFGGG